MNMQPRSMIRGRMVVPVLIFLVLLSAGGMTICGGLPFAGSETRSVWEAPRVKEARADVVEAEQEFAGAISTAQIADELMQRTLPHLGGPNPYAEAQIFGAHRKLQYALMRLDRALERTYGPSILAPREIRLRFELERLQARLAVFDRLVNLAIPSDDMDAFREFAKTRALLQLRIGAIEKELASFDGEDDSRKEN